MWFRRLIVLDGIDQWWEQKLPCDLQASGSLSSSVSHVTYKSIRTSSCSLLEEYASSPRPILVHWLLKDICQSSTVLCPFGILIILVCWEVLILKCLCSQVKHYFPQVQVSCDYFGFFFLDLPTHHFNYESCQYQKFSSNLMSWGLKIFLCILMWIGWFFRNRLPDFSWECKNSKPSFKWLLS